MSPQLPLASPDLDALRALLTARGQDVPGLLAGLWDGPWPAFVLDAKGHLRHDGGIVDSPGLYALGLPVLRRRKSTFIHGIEDDAREVIDHLNAYLAGVSVGVLG